MGRGKNAIDTRHSLQYRLCQWQRLINLSLSHTDEKKMLLFLATVLLWCMGLRKNSIGLDPHRKKKLATLLLWCKGFRKNSIRLDPHRNLFSSLATVSLWYMEKNYGDLEKNQSKLDTHRKKCLISGYNITIVYWTVHRKKVLLFMATLLL